MGATATTYGLLQEFTETETGDIDEALDADGDVADYNARNGRAECRMRVLVDSGATAPTFGASLEITGATNAGDYIVSNVESTETNTGFKELAITAVRWIANSLPTA
jgi:hypothetical protein